MTSEPSRRAHRQPQPLTAERVRDLIVRSLASNFEVVACRHADGWMTREIYTHVTDTMLQEAADAIERAVGGADADQEDERDAEPDSPADGSSSGSRDDNDTGDDEGQEPGYGA